MSVHEGGVLFAYSFKVRDVTMLNGAISLKCCAPYMLHIT